MRLLNPLAYVYIGLIILREMSGSSPTFHTFVRNYIPYLSFVIDKMKASSIFVEIWVFIEAIFYIIQKLHIRYLQFKDPLEASLSAAPITTIEEREELMKRMLKQIHADDPVNFIRGWFFDEKLENITRYDVHDFLAWCLFEGRNQEHLTETEARQLQTFFNDFEWILSMHLYGVDVDADENKELQKRRLVLKSLGSKDAMPRINSVDFRLHGLFNSARPEDTSEMNEHDELTIERKLSWEEERTKRMKPRKDFHFIDSSQDEPPSFFSDLFENYKRNHERYRDQIQKIGNIASRIQEAEEQAMAAASSIYENAYSKLINKGSAFDNRLHAMSDVMHNQLNEAWNSMRNVKDRLETARFVASRKRKLNSQLNGYRMLLEKSIMSSHAVPPPSLVALMQKITQCTQSLEAIENSAANAFLKAMKLDVSYLLQRREPQRYAKYSEDPLLGLAVYPLIFNLAILGLTDGGLRYVLKRRGFERLNIGSTVYYYHKGICAEEEDNDIREDDEDEQPLTPIIFCHGIGIGLGFYLTLIDKLLEKGHPILLPEIPYVCGFRPWLFRKTILTPHAVVATLTAMLATHGHMKATFVGHSYGTSWLSYMCKYSPDTVASMVFLDPICFCLHHPCLTKSFVYHRADPGSVSYMIKTDVIINWTIQRAFPWQDIILFADQIPKHIPCSVFLSEFDILIPVSTVSSYLKTQGAQMSDFVDATEEHYSKGPINVTMLRGQGHGDWTLDEDAMSEIANAARVLTEQADCGRGDL
jgi:pimeloyl-ACP methyl ester carboxylesterase